MPYIIDITSIPPKRYSADSGKSYDIPRINGITQLIAGKTSDKSLKHWGFAIEIETQKPSIDYILSDPITDSNGIYIQEWVYAEPDLHSLREDAVSRLNKILDDKVESLADKFPRYERETWPKQIEEASAWQSDNNVLSPTIDRIMIDGEDKAELCASILEKAEGYQVIADNYVRIRRQYRDAIRAAGSRSEIDALIEEVNAL